MVVKGKKDSFLLKPLAYRVSKHAYVVYDGNHRTATDIIMHYLNNEGIYTLGRFSEWQYYNMDVCVKSSLDLATSTLKKFLNVWLIKLAIFLSAFLSERNFRPT